MKKKITPFIFSILVITGFTSCDEDDTAITDPQLQAPATYSFERNGTTSVSFSGQKTRLMMGEELVTVLKQPQTTVSELQGKFSHIEGANNFSDPSLNASNKSLRSKVAASTDLFSANSTDQAAIRADFERWLNGQASEVFPAWNNTASAGVPGQLQQAGGGTVRWINGKGLEYDQAFVKSMIGALMIDQILNNYLSPAVLDQASNRENNDAGVLEVGKNYTTMEHKWDEAFGYLYGLESDPRNPELNVDSFLNKYLARVENDSDFTGIGAEIYDALKLGRAAIVAGNYDLRDQQADIIKEKLSEVIGIRAVYYLENGALDINRDKAKAFHDLSEGYGFIYSLQFTRVPGTNEPYFSKNEVDAMIDQLMSGNGFWDATPEMLQQMSIDIATRFNFTIEQAKR